MTGNLGKRAAGMNPLRGQNNVQGANDAGATPVFLPGYQRVDDAGDRGEVRRGLGRAGLDRAGPQPQRDDEGDAQGPHQGHVPDGRGHRHLRAQRLRGRVGHERARVPGRAGHLLQRELPLRRRHPAGRLLRREGGRLHQLRPPRPAGQEGRRAAGPGARRLGGPARPDAARRPRTARLQHPSEIYAEMAALAPKFAGISHERIENEGGLQWPVEPPDAPSTEYLHKGGVHARQGPLRAGRVPAAVRARGRGVPAGAVDRADALPLQRRHPDSALGGLSGKQPEGFVEIHPKNAGGMGSRTARWSTW